MVPGLEPVAGKRSAAQMASLTTVLRWPDREQARGYVQVFPLIGHLPDTGVFRRLPAADERRAAKPAERMVLHFWQPP